MPLLGCLEESKEVINVVKAVNQPLKVGLKSTETYGMNIKRSFFINYLLLYFPSYLRSYSENINIFS